MHQKDRLRQKSPESDFDSYYLKQYKETWEVLKSSLKEYKPLVNISEIIKEPSIKEPYYLDPASVQCALNLPVNKNLDILDMCAAPGGKALLTALRLNGSGSLTLNDVSSNRIIRLKKVISEHLDMEVSSNISFSCKDATKIGIRTKNKYDCILLDAPCSSERHVINSPEELQNLEFDVVCGMYKFRPIERGPLPKGKLLPEVMMNDLEPYYIFPVHVVQYFLGYFIVRPTLNDLGQINIKFWLSNVGALLMSWNTRYELKSVVEKMYEEKR